MQLFAIIPQPLGVLNSPTFAGLTITGNSVLGLNSSVFQPATDSTTFFQIKDAAGAIVGNFDTTNGRFGIGIINPVGSLHVLKDHVGESIAGLYFDAYRSDATPRPIINFRASRGTPASPANVQNNDKLGEFLFQGYAGGSFRAVADIAAGVDTGTISAASLPTFLSFYTTPDGSLTRLERMKINRNGNVGVGLWGTDSPEYIFHIRKDHTGASTAGIGFEAYRSDGYTARPIMIFKSSRGTPASPVNVVAGDRIGEFMFNGYAGGAFRAVGNISGWVGTGTISSTSLPTYFTFHTTPDLSVSRLERMRIDQDGNIGINLTNPSARLHIRSSADNNIELDESGGISRILSVNDARNAKIPLMFAASRFEFNEGNVVIGTGTSILRFSVEEKSGMTPIGGFAIMLTNNTGANSVEGQLVEADDTDENSYKKADANALDVIGVVYNAGVADGSEVWIVQGGIAEVLLDAGGCVHHDRLISSATAGSADVSNAPAVAVHFQEIGHAIETVVGAGLAKAVIHLL